MVRRASSRRQVESSFRGPRQQGGLWSNRGCGTEVAFELKPQRAGNFDFLDSGDADNIGEGHTRVALRLRREESETSFSECSTAVSRWVRRALRGRQRAIWASHKSFWRKDKGDSGAGGGKDFHGQERLLDTHQSKADPEALVTVARQITRRT